MSARYAVFVDRDGTLADTPPYVGDPDLVTLILGAADAVAVLNRAGFVVVVVSNQGGIARGLLTAAQVERVNQRVVSLLADGGARVEATYVCPHHPDFDRTCDCRKPSPGMLLRAALDLDLDLAGSWMVGDKALDVEAGLAAGARSVLVRTGDGRRDEHLVAGYPDVAVVDDLPAAATHILSCRT